MAQIACCMAQITCCMAQITCPGWPSTSIAEGRPACCMSNTIWGRARSTCRRSSMACFEDVLEVLAPLLRAHYGLSRDRGGAPASTAACSPGRPWPSRTQLFGPEHLQALRGYRLWAQAPQPPACSVFTDGCLLCAQQQLCLWKCFGGDFKHCNHTLRPYTRCDHRHCRLQPHADCNHMLRP